MQNSVAAVVVMAASEVGGTGVHDLNDLAILAKLADRLSFEAAARDLGISGSTVSRRISALEARLGVPLVVRTTRSVRLTPAGAVYADQCREMVAAAHRADALARMHLEGMKGDLSVNAPTLFGRLLLVPILAEFASRHPDVRIRLTLNNGRVDLAAADVDLVLRTGDLPDSGLKVRRLATTPFVVVASPACLAHHGMPRSIDDFANLPCMAFDRGSEPGWASGGPGQPVKVDARFVADDLEALRDAAIAGLGFALLPFFAVAAAVSAGRLSVVPVEHAFGEAPLSLVFPSHKVPNRCARALADAIIAAMRTRPDWRMVEADETSAVV